MPLALVITLTDFCPPVKELRLEPGSAKVTVLLATGRPSASVTRTLNGSASVVSWRPLWLSPRSFRIRVAVIPLRSGDPRYGDVTTGPVTVSPTVAVEVPRGPRPSPHQIPGAFTGVARLTARAAVSAS